MKLIVDANVLISALIKDSTARKVLLDPKHEMYTPEYIVQEIYAYVDVISKKNSLSRDENLRALEILLKYCKQVPPAFYLDKLKEAIEIMKKIDEKDAQYLALAMSFKNDGILSEDKHFEKQNVVKVWKIKDLI